MDATGGQVDDMLRYAAKKKACQAAPPSFANDDEVDGFPVSDLENEGGGIAEPGQRLNFRDSDRFCTLLGAQQDLTGAGLQNAADVIANIQRTDTVIEEALLDVDDYEKGSGGLGQFGRGIYRATGAIGVIRSDKYPSHRS